MAGEIQTVGVSDNAFSRNAVDVQVSHTDSNTWNPPNASLTVEYSIDGGATWIQNGTWRGGNNVCLAGSSDFNNVSSFTSPTLSDFTIYAPAGIPHNTSILVRARANTIDGDFATSTPNVTPDYPTFTCSSSSITETGAQLTLGDDSPTGQANVASCGADTIIWEYATVSGGPYTALPSEAVDSFSPTKTLTGLTPNTQYFWRARLSEVTDTNGEYLTTAECSFTTLASTADTPSFQPDPCTTCGGGAGDSALDAEDNILCDYVNGEVVGSALAVYTYDSDGNPTGAPTFVIPGTDDPYVPQGTMMSCPGTLGCLEPVNFHFTTSTTGPVDHPGRQYDITLPINPGFAVQSLQVDQVTSPANIVWEVDDPDGETFRQNLTTFIEGRVPASATVTITNPNAGVAQVCGAALPMQIHIECVRLDENPPDLIELIYNAGQDMIINPAYNESPALNPPVSQGNYGFRLLSRQDDPGPFPGNPPANDALCTDVANRGWETNDIGRTFEIWGQDIVNGSDVTPTPRGTPVQEITSDGPPPGGISTIWQTFQAPASGNFIIRVVHGARDAGEIHRITLDNGDTDDAQNGDLIDDTSTPGVVTNSAGGPGPWTQFNQTIPLVAGSTYTLALSTTESPADNNARGGLFTDMRAYIDRPDQRATATVDDDTCVVTVDETTTVCDDQLWSPVCTNGNITGWRNAETNQLLTNAQFWGQAPAPVPGPCPGAAAAGDGGSVAANLVHTYPVCATVGGVRTNLQRVVITDASGGVLADSFIGPDGAPVETPTTYTIGSCTDTAFMGDQVLCDDNGPFLRKYVQAVGATGQPEVRTFRNFTLDGAAYTPVGVVRNCQEAPCGGCETLTLCDSTSSSNPPALEHSTDNVATAEYRAAYPLVGVTYDPADVDGSGLWSGGQTVFPDKGAFAIHAWQVSAGDITIVPLACGLPNQVQLTATVRVTRTAPDGSSGNSGGFGFHNNGVAVGTSANVPGTSVGVSRVLNISAVVPYADLLAGNIGIGLALQTTVNFTHGGWVADQFALTATPTEPVTGCGTGETTKFLRTTCRDCDGNVTSVTDTNFDGSVYLVQGAVQDCTVEPTSVDQEGICYTLTSTGETVHTGWARHDDSIPNTPQTPNGIAFFDALGNFIDPTADGFTQVVCSETECCPVVVSQELCYDDGTGVKRATSLRQPDGTILIIDQATGAAVLPGDVVACSSPVTARARLLAAGTSWTPGADVTGTLVAVSATGLTGTFQITDGEGNVSGPYPAGYTAEWSYDPDSLVGPQSFTADAASTVAVAWTER